MRINDVKTYSELLSFVKVELAKQTATRKTAVIELPSEHFFKLIKFIQFNVKDETTISDSCTAFTVRINEIKTKVVKK